VDFLSKYIHCQQHAAEKYQQANQCISFHHSMELLFYLNLIKDKAFH